MEWLILLLFSGLRLYFLTKFPPYTDESLFVRWGLVATNSWQSLFLPLLYVGRQPFLLWLFGLGARSTADPFVGARLISVLFGIVSVLLLYQLAKKEFGKGPAVWSVFLLAIGPVFIFHQSVALYDGALFTAVLALWFSMATLVRYPVPIHILVYGVLLAATLYIKSNAIIPAAVSLCTVLYLLALRGVSRRMSLVILGIAMGVCFILLLPLLTHPYAGQLLRELQIFTASIPDANEKVSVRIFRNTMVVIGTLIVYMPVVWWPAFLRGFSLAGHEKRVMFGGAGIVSLAAVVAVTRTDIFARYYLFALGPLLPVAGYGLAYLFRSGRTLRVLTVLLCVLSFIQTVVLLISPKSYFSLFPNIMGMRETGYIVGYTSGYAQQSLSAYLETDLKHLQNLILAVPDVPGNPTDYLLSRYFFSQRIHVVLSDSPDSVRDTSKRFGLPSMYVTRQSIVEGQPQKFRNLHIVAQFQSPGNDAVLLYK